MNAESVARVLGGHRSGNAWMACCPAHDDTTPSLSISDAVDGRILVYCHAGCGQGEVIDELRARSLWNSSSDRFPRPVVGRRTAPTPRVKGPHWDESALGFRIWRSSRSAKGSKVATYLDSRGICIEVPDSIRWCPKLKHPSGVWPAMVALVTRGVDGRPMAIHRTYLSHDGREKAPVSPQKMMLGPCRGGAVRLAKPELTLMVGEGIETCLAAMQSTGLPAWAALSTSGLRALQIPAEIYDVIILADGDDPGEAAALDAARRWAREGRAVRIARPPSGMDFNDVLLGCGVSLPEGSA